jgi:serine/threonine protein phosphatase 1
MSGPRFPAVASDGAILATLRGAGRIWAVGAILGDAHRLAALHRQVEREIKPGDQLVYLGGYLGVGPDVAATVNELLLFRRAFLAEPGVELRDVVFLRGAQEEMWQKLLQIQFASNPPQVLRWMIDHGIDATVRAYGGRSEDGLAAAEEGVLALTHWTSALRQAMRDRDGHNALLSSLKHAAFTDDERLLFVHAGIEPARPLAEQRDHFWWGAPAFETWTGRFEGFQRIVRGHALRGGGLVTEGPVITLDAGNGHGGSVTAACLSPDGEILRLLTG